MSKVAGTQVGKATKAPALRVSAGFPLRQGGQMLTILLKPFRSLSAKIGETVATQLPGRANVRVCLRLRISASVLLLVRDAHLGVYARTLDTRPPPCMLLHAGTFLAWVQIDGEPVVNSPTRLRLISTNPDVASSMVTGEGTRQCIKAETAVIRIQFHDVYGNPTIQSDAFREWLSRVIRLRIAAPGTSVHHGGTDGEHAFEGTWLTKDSDCTNAGHSEFLIKYMPSSPGAFSLHLYVQKTAQERVAFPNSPFSLSVHANVADQVVDVAIIDSGGIMPGDYKVIGSVFQDAQKKWGECTVDAFASPSTALCPRFWTASQMAGAEAANAFKQQWDAGEVIWAHPPANLMPKVVSLLEKDTRLAEVFVVCPKSTADWAYRLNKLSDGHLRYMGGHLEKVASDAPKRVGEWPIVVFHIPAPLNAFTPLHRLPKRMREEHADHWAPGWFTSGAWQAAEEDREGIHRAAQQMRMAALLLLGFSRWLRSARATVEEQRAAAAAQAAARKQSLKKKLGKASVMALGKGSANPDIS